MAADQARMMAFQAMMAKMQHQQSPGEGAAPGGNDPTAQIRAAMAGMMQQQAQQQGGQGGQGGHSHQAPDLQQRQQMMQMFMKKAAAAAAASGADMNQDGASGGGHAAGHSHGGSGHGHGHSHGHGTEHALDDKGLADHQLAMAMHQQMNFMQRQHRSTLNTGYVLQHPEISQGPRESYIYGGGHYTPPVFGWGNLAKNYVDPQDLLEVESGNKKPSENLQEKLQVMMEGNGAVSLQNVWLFTLPLLGRLRVVKDRLGLLQAAFVFLYWLYGNIVTWNVVLLPQYSENHLSVAVLIMYFVLSALTITSFFRAATASPGTTPDSLFSDATEDWTFCEACQKRRPPKAHHCRRCGQCVPLMDHHCPWINNCVGQSNQWLFLQLVLYATLISILTLTLDLLFKFYFDECQSCDQGSFSQRHQHGLINSCIVLAALMLMSAVGLFCTQHTNIILGITTVEWMKMQREMKLAGDSFDWSKIPKPTMSLKEAYQHVCGLGPVLTWPFPCRRRRAPMTTPKSSV